MVIMKDKMPIITNAEKIGIEKGKIEGKIEGKIKSLAKKSTKKAVQSF